jgi:hypothetical protein
LAAAMIKDRAPVRSEAAFMIAACNFNFTDMCLWQFDDGKYKFIWNTMYGRMISCSKNTFSEKDETWQWPKPHRGIKIS